MYASDVFVCVGSQLSNILLSVQHTAKIADMGLSKKLATQQSSYGLVSSYGMRLHRAASAALAEQSIDANAPAASSPSGSSGSGQVHEHHGAAFSLPNIHALFERFAFVFVRAFIRQSCMKC